MRNTTRIQTGVETPERSDTTADSIDPDVCAYARNGEFATTWAVERLNETTVQVEIHRHQGDVDEIGVFEQRPISADMATADWALARATADPPTAVKAAMAFFCTDEK